MNYQLKIDGMSCGHCVNAVKQALEGVEGVESAQVNLEQGSASVAAADGVKLDTLIEAVQEEGYEARAN